MLLKITVLLGKSLNGIQYVQNLNSPYNNHNKNPDGVHNKGTN